MKSFWIWILIIAVLIIAFRIALPYIVKRYVNNTLQQLEGYNGSVEDININLFRGAYVIKRLIITDESNAISVPFISVSKIDLSVYWSALFKGSIVGEIILQQPAINFAVDEDASQDGSETDWLEVVKDLLPIRIDRFEVINGSVTYYDFTTQPELNLYVENLNVIMTNLTNVESEGQKLPSALSATGSSLGNGIITADAKLNALKQIPDLDLTLTIEQVDMTALNEFVRTYSHVDIEKGTFNLYSEIVIDQGNLKGYVKPVLEDLKVLDWEKEKEGFLKKTWEAMVAGVKELFENQSEEQVATEVPLEGDLNNMSVKAGLWPTIWGLFKNAFVEALSKQTEDAIDFPLQQGK